MTQHFRPIRLTVEDRLFSQIIRFGRDRCLRCHKFKALQAAHIFGRACKSTRHALEPKPNAIPLCSDCHSWFDTHVDDSPIFKEEVRPYIFADDNRYVFLVRFCGYTWNDLQKLYVMSKSPYPGYKRNLPEIREKLRAHLSALSK